MQSTITSKGQTTVPQGIREALRAEQGSLLNWHLLQDGTILVRAKTQSIRDLAGLLKAPQRKRIAVQEMNAWQ